MHQERYTVEIEESATAYEFTSEGINGKVKKMVIYDRLKYDWIYNLAFGDKDEITGSIDDYKITNNGDSKKVLATVACTLYTFTDKFPDAFIIALGNNKARTRLYRMGICNNYDIIKNDFYVFGSLNDIWYPFEKNVDYEAFLVTRKKK